MSRSGGQSEVSPPVLKFPSKLGTHLSTHCRRDERLSRPFPTREQILDLWCGSAIRYHSITGPYQVPILCKNQLGGPKPDFAGGKCSPLLQCSFP
ncbi:hypothetical protein TNCV_4082651 [Trichonephila clavipes]|nr:hypothetical protein TNCV_4082651 [Trichonephila clavipes]